MAEYAKRSEVTIETMVSGPRAPDHEGVREHDGSNFLDREIRNRPHVHSPLSLSHITTTYYRYLTTPILRLRLG